MYLLLTICAIVFSSFGIDANEFRDDKYKLNVSYEQDKWTQVEGESFRDRITLQHISLSATLNIVAFKFSEPITANGLVEKRINAVYDGWQVMTTNDIKPMELKRLNVSEGIASIYRKPYLDDSLNQRYRVVADICLVADEYFGIIINFDASNMQTLIKLKNEFDTFFDSFWYGDTKPTINYIVNNTNEWVVTDQNIFRSRFNNVKVKLFDSIKILNNQAVSRNSDLSNAQHFFNENGNYILGDDHIYTIQKLGDVTKQSFYTKGKDVILLDDGFLIIERRPILKISRYNNRLELIEEIEYEEAVNEVIFNNGFFIFISDSKIQMVKNEEVKWTFEHNYKISHYVAFNDMLIITDNTDTTLKVINISDGSLFATIEDFNKLGSNLEEGEVRKYQFTDLLVQENTLFAVGEREVENGKRVAFASINMEKMYIEELDFRRFKKCNVVGITEDFLIIHYQKGRDKQMQLEALDPKTFEIVWSVDFTDMKDIALTPQQIIALNAEESLVALNIKNAKKSTEIDLSLIYNEDEGQEDEDQEDVGQEDKVSVKRLFVLNNSLAAIIAKDNAQEIVIMR